jgi:hypothetical protein
MHGSLGYKEELILNGWGELRGKNKVVVYVYDSVNIKHAW